MLKLLGKTTFNSAFVDQNQTRIGLEIPFFLNIVILNEIYRQTLY
jgi:hypothetical protein